jgi:hypothetical protein
MKVSALLKVSVRYGVIAGILAVVLMIALLYLGKNPFSIYPFLDFRIILFGIFIFFSLKEFRDLHQGGVLYFWQGLFASFIVVLLGSVIGCAGLWIFGLYEPRMVELYVSEMTAYLKTFPPEEIERIGKEVYDRNLRLLPSTNISTLAKSHLVQGMIIGFFISIIFSVILRRTN